MVNVDWNAILLVFVVALVAVVAVVSLYSLGLRLLAVGSEDGGHRPAAVTFAAWLCIGIGALAVLYGVYLVIPLFHSS